MINVLLTSENFVRTNFNISDNMQSKFLLSAIRESQDIDLQEIIGTDLYTKLQDLVSGGTIGNEENVAYKNLLDSVQYFLGYQTLARLCVISTFKFDNIGINTTTDDNVQIPSTKDVFEIQEFYQHKADYYCKRVQNYILEHYEQLPEVSSTNVYRIKAHLNNCVTNGLLLTGKNGKGRYNDYYNKTHIGYDKP